MSLLAEQLEQLGEIERLYQVRVETRVLRTREVLIRPPAGQGDQQRIPAPFHLLKALGGFESIHHRHAEIKYHGLRFEFDPLLKCLDAARTGARFESQHLKQLRESNR